MAIVSSSADPWDQPSTSSQQIARHREPVPDDWENDDEEEEASEAVWEKANNKAPMPDVVVSRSSTSLTSAVVSPPSTAFQSPMRILKRPPSNSSAASSAGLDGSTRETLAEREARYHAARERIFREGRTDNPDQSIDFKNDEVHPANGPTATLVRNPRGPVDSPEDAPAKGFGSRRTAKSPAEPPRPN